MIHTYQLSPSNFDTGCDPFARRFHGELRDFFWQKARESYDYLEKKKFQAHQP
jgi:hypothetical protein